MSLYLPAAVPKVPWIAVSVNEKRSQVDYLCDNRQGNFLFEIIGQSEVEWLVYTSAYF